MVGNVSVYLYNFVAITEDIILPNNVTGSTYTCVSTDVMTTLYTLNIYFYVKKRELRLKLLWVTYG